MRGIGLSIWPGTPAQAALRLVRHADDLGYHSVWVTESTAAPSRDAISLLGAMAATTSRIKLSTGIINVYTRTPLLIASTVASLDEISGMRTIVGLGTGHQFSIEKWHSLRFKRPIVRMKEYIQTIRMLLLGDKVDFEGETISMSKAQLAHKPPRADVPIFAAGVGEKMVKAVSSIADGILLTFNPLDRVPKVLQWIKSNPSGRIEPELACYLVSFVSGDRSKATHASKRVVAAYCAAPFYNKMFVEMSFMEQAAAISDAWWRGEPEKAMAQVNDEMASHFVTIGSPDEVVGRVEKYIKAGVSIPIIAPFYFAQEDDHLIRLLSRVAEYFQLRA